MKKADIDSLVGQKFTSKSGNVAEVKRATHAVVEIQWARDPHSKNDEREFNRWANSMVESTWIDVEAITE